jgi:hypothetical protein
METLARKAAKKDASKRCCENSGLMQQAFAYLKRWSR